MSHLVNWFIQRNIDSVIEHDHSLIKDHLDNWSTGKFNHSEDLSIKKWDNCLINKQSNVVMCCIFSMLIYHYQDNDYIKQITERLDYKYQIYICNNGLVYGIFRNDKFSFLVFKGSSSVADYLVDLDIKEIGMIDDVKVHKGFYTLLKENSKDIISNTSKYNINFITGHSLGGALALLYGSVYEYKKFIVSFGAPKVGNELFYKHYCDKRYNIRFVNKSDIVPSLPISLLGRLEYTHQKGSRISIGHKGYIRHPLRDHSIVEYFESILEMMSLYEIKGKITQMQLGIDYEIPFTHFWKLQVHKVNNSLEGPTNKQLKELFFTDILEAKEYIEKNNLKKDEYWLREIQWQWVDNLFVPFYPNTV